MVFKLDLVGQSWDTAGPLNDFGVLCIGDYGLFDRLTLMEQHWVLKSKQADAKSKLA